MSKLQDLDSNSRRNFLGKAAVAGLSIPLGLGLVHSGVVLAKSPYLGSSIDFSGSNNPTQLQGALTKLSAKATRRMHLVNVHTGDDFDLIYFKNGKYLRDSIAQFNHLMRDRRANTATNMDTTLYDQLYLLRESMGTDQAIHVLSGYRTAETNAKLRRRSKRVAKYSLHMEGRAADIYVPGVSVRKLHKLAINLSAGGVGMYSSSNFIHLDTGPVRNWGR